MSCKPSPKIQELTNKSLEDAEWQLRLYNLLQNQTEVDVVFDPVELMCQVFDENLFAHVHWVRNNFFFKTFEMTSAKVVLDMSQHNSARAFAQTTHFGF